MHVKKITLIVAILGFSLAMRAADDPFVGTWKVNHAKSIWNPGLPPKSQVFQLEAVNHGQLKVTSTTVNENGKTSVNARIETYDGKPHGVTQDEGGKDAIVARRIGRYRIEGEDWSHGKVMARFTRTVSKDGKTLTIETNGVDYPKVGETYHHYRIFDKQ